MVVGVRVPMRQAGGVCLILCPVPSRMDLDGVVGLTARALKTQASANECSPI